MGDLYAEPYKKIPHDNKKTIVGERVAILNVDSIGEPKGGLIGRIQELRALVPDPDIFKAVIELLSK
jgi:hypothetical protein